MGDAREFTPTDEQRVAIEHPLSPLLIVAGAGTGKTTVMVERIAWTVESRLAMPEEILGLTFTNKAARELRDRVRLRIGADADVIVTTYHGFCARLVAEHALELDLHPDVQLLNRAQAWQLLFGVFDDFRFEKRSTFKPELIVNHALVLASRCANHLVDVARIEPDCDDIVEHCTFAGPRNAAAGRKELCQVVAAYERRKRARNLLDYDDQIRLAVQLVREHPEIAAGLADQHRVVLLDEYQDTNYAQRALLQALYPPGAPVTAVGDDMQSIYAFRGAHLDNLRHFDQHFPPVTRLPLTENRRSGPEIVALANAIQGTIPDALDKTLRSLPGAPASTISCFVAADDHDEAAEIARQIAELGAPYAERAVLCRKRRLIAPIAAAIESLGIKVDVVGTSGLLERPEVVDVVSWLEVLADPRATVALLRILRGPRYRIGLRDLAALAAHDELPVAVFAATTTSIDGLSDDAAARLRAFAVEHGEVATLARRLPVLDAVEAIIERTGLWSAAGERGRENLLRFLDIAERFSPVEGDAGLPAFVEYLDLLDNSEEDLPEAHASGEDAVRIMTIHQAKGLEFDHVWVPGLAGSGISRIFPDGRAGENPLSQQDALPWWLREDDGGLPPWREIKRLNHMTDALKERSLEEEWRLLYVACTRARRGLVCSAAQWYPGPAKPQGPSAFYEFIASQSALVRELFRRDPPDLNPQVAAMERLRAAAEAPPPPAPRPSRTSRRTAAAAPGAAPGLFDGAGEVPRALIATRRRAPMGLSVTSLVSYARCPRQFYWSVVRPLPRPPSAAARLGTDVHRWIERRAGEQRQGVLVDTGELALGRTSIEAELRASFLASPYAALDPERVEAPFVLAVGARIVRGRIDAVYRRDGKLELVDFKTGRAPAEGDRGAEVQLDLYGLAAVDAWRADPAEIRTTYCYLRADSDGPAELISTDWDADRLAEVRSRLADDLAALDAEQYRPSGGAWCERCDYLPFCAVGRAAAKEVD